MVNIDKLRTLINLSKILNVKVSKMSGRILNPVWKYFDQDTSNKYNVKAICKGCKVQCQGIAARMQKHADVCVILNIIEGGNVKPVQSGLKRQFDEIVTQDNVTQSPKKQRLITSNVIKTSDEENQQINEQLGRAIYSSNSSFTLAENPHFQKYGEMLRPGFKVASRQDFGGSILDKVYSEEVDRAKQSLKGQTVTLAIDGWSNITNEPVIGVSITANGTTSLVATVDTTGQPHTADYMTNVTIEAIQKAEEMFEVKVGHVVTDGAVNMEAMRRLISDALGSSILITYHCQPHLLNLLAKDVKKEQSVVVNKVITVIKFFRNKHEPQAKLKEMNINKPPLPCETRWNTFRDSLKWYCDNWANLLSLMADLQPQSGTERKFIENMQIRSGALDLLAIFDAISAGINNLQSDTATIADAIEQWFILLDKIKDLNNPSVIKMTEARSQETLVEAAFLAANLLDHRYLGQRLSPSQVITATKFIKKLNPDAENGLTLFLAKRAPYDLTLLSDNVDPVSWWTAGKRFGFDSELSEVALLLVTAIANSAGLERQFSTLKYTYGHLRTNLGVQKAEKNWHLSTDP